MDDRGLPASCTFGKQQRIAVTGICWSWVSTALTGGDILFQFIQEVLQTLLSRRCCCSESFWLWIDQSKSCPFRWDNPFYASSFACIGLSINFAAHLRQQTNNVHVTFLNCGIQRRVPSLWIEEPRYNNHYLFISANAAVVSETRKKRAVINML